MKKIILVGELNVTLQDINLSLSEKFQVQLCPPDVKQIDNLIKLLRPNLIIVSQIGLVNEDIPVFDFLNQKYNHIQLLVIATTENSSHFESYTGKITVLKRPIPKQQIVDTCCELLDEEVKADSLTEAEEVVKTVMVVDDSGLVLRNVKHLLEPKYKVFVANSGEQAIKFIPRKKPDLIILDYEMPEMDGKETFENIKKDEVGKRIPVIFLTGVADREHIMAVLALNPAGYILKPPTEDKLLELIQKVLGE